MGLCRRSGGAGHEVSHQHARRVRPEQPQAYLRSALRRDVSIERGRRTALRTAVRASLARKRGARLRLASLRRHLAEFFAAAWATLTAAELSRACRGLAETTGAGKRTFVVGVVLKAPRPRSLVARWESVLSRECMGAEPPMIRRPAPVVYGTETGDPENTLHHPGLVVRSNGAWKQTVDHSIVVLTADTRNSDGSRGRPRRHVEYFARLRAAAVDATLSRRQRQMVDVILAGGTRRDIGERLGLSSVSRVHQLVCELHAELGIAGPGSGR